MIKVAVGAILLTQVPIFAESAGLKKAKTALIASSKAEQKVKDYVVKSLVPLCSHETVIAAVEAQNAKGMTLADIQKIDDEWKNAEDELDIMMELMSNECAEVLVKFVKKNKAVVEVFVMDNQGANVGQNDLTGDYWQGDEAKWKNSYLGGKGGVDVGKIKLDESSNMTLQQISLPVVNASGKVIGAVCFGLNIDKI